MSRRIAISEPIIISRFWKNRSHDAVEVSLKSFEGMNLCDVRTYTMRDGGLVPTTKGISVVLPRLPDLARAINKALAKARELGLIDDEGGGGK
jgi:Transcriptional Coactivator p15 (PC4)